MLIFPASVSISINLQDNRLRFLPEKKVPYREAFKNKNSVIHSPEDSKNIREAVKKKNMIFYDIESKAG